MEIKTEVIGTTLVVKIDGEIDHHTAPKFRAEVDKMINLYKICNLILDFDAVTFMDSSGIGVIAGRYKEIRAQGGKVMLIRAKPQVDRILEISGLKTILECSN